jgi:hypothetical protein
MSVSTLFRESMALAAAGLAQYANVCTSDPGTTGLYESTGVRGAISWLTGGSDGVVTGVELDLASVPIGYYTHVALFSGASGSNFLLGYQLSDPISLSVVGPIRVVPSLVYPGA